MIYFGFDEVVYGWPRYFDLCNAFEVRGARDTGETPSLATLNRWRVESPRGFAWLLHAEPEIAASLVGAYDRGETVLPPEIDSATAATEARAHALPPKAIGVEPSLIHI